jgi:hypothetical protein
MFMDARDYFLRRYSFQDCTAITVPDQVISAYRKLITRGLFSPHREDDHER